MSRQFSWVLLFASVFLHGCDRSDAVSADELARAMGIQTWQVRLPSDLPPDASVGLALLRDDGSRVTGGGIGGFKPHDLVTVFLWEIEKENQTMRYAIVTNEAAARGLLYADVHANITTDFNPGRIRQANEFLLKGSETEKVTSDANLKKGEWGVALVVHDQQQ